MNNTYNSNLFARLENGSGYSNTNESEVLNPFVNFNHYQNAQTLADVLVAESIQMRGIDLYYLPREFQKLDLMFGEDPTSKFTKAWKFAGYIESFDGYQGDNSIFTKFGLSVNDEINIAINPNLFKYQTNNTEPMIGDLIYFPMDRSLFEINWVQPYTPFYQLGQNAQRKITAQKFIYSGEELNPELQRNDGINIPEFSDLDLEPISNIDGESDIFKQQYAEVDQINKEASDFVEPYTVINGTGEQTPGPFDDDFFNDKYL